jgi:sarcosine oxidase subunit delta
MQLFTCPFCGRRDETEFHYSGEAGNDRPDGLEITAAQWAEYLYMRANPKGPAREIWVHTACGEFFVMERDTVSHAVVGTRSLDGDHVR